MSITVYNLNRSRSHRVVWLLEELKIPYELVKIYRDSTTGRANEEACKIHALGKFPVIKDGELILAESGAIVEYIGQKYADKDFSPEPSSAMFANYLFWLHYAEGSFMLPAMMRFYEKRLKLDNEAYTVMVKREMQKHLEFVDDHLKKQHYFIGQKLSGADIMMAFCLDICSTLQLLDSYPAINSYLLRIRERAAYKKAVLEAEYGFVDSKNKA
ncbi:MAG: glutathione S-transferase family protein [Proteobacteria bacterium]|nr:glutathione S-transferase family protein [Pseudomonadota bacterium]